MDRTVKKQANILIALCFIAYSVAYIGRLNYNASIVELIEQTGSTKDAAGLVSSFFFAAYGAGQLVNGILSKKYNTRYSVAIALAGSAVSNVLMAVCGSLEIMRFVWLANGLFQSVLWSSIIKTVSEKIPDELLSNAVVVLSTPMAFGTLGAYGLAALFSALDLSYTIIFIVSGALLAVTAAAWFIGVDRVSRNLKKANQPEKIVTEKKRPALTASFLIPGAVILLVAIANGFIKDGVTTWTPSILTEDFGVNTSLSILVTLLLPLVSIAGAVLVKMLHKRQPNASILNAALYAMASVILAAVLMTLRLRNPVLTMFLFACSACLMSAVNNLITSVIPVYARETMDSGVLAGVLDTFCYIGSSMSTALLGDIAENKTWNDVFTVLLIFSAVSFALCIIAVFFSKRPAGTKAEIKEGE